MLSMLQKAIAGSLGLRTQLTLQHVATDDVVIDLPDIDICCSYSCQSLAKNFTLPLCEFCLLIHV